MRKYSVCLTILGAGALLLAALPASAVIPVDPVNVTTPKFFVPPNPCFACKLGGTTVRPTPNLLIYGTGGFIFFGPKPTGSLGGPD